MLVEYVALFGEFQAMWCGAVVTSSASVTSYASASLDVTSFDKVTYHKSVYLYLCHNSYKVA